MTAFVCEVCQAPLRYHGGPHNPRWCAKHRNSVGRREQRARQAAYRDRPRASWPPAFCSGCRARLLRPAEYCGFCVIELGVELVAA